MILTKHQEKILKAFDALNTDIDIVVLYTRIYGDPGLMTVRDMQMKLAPQFAVMNKKLEGLIELGEIKRTYRYTHSGE